MIVQRMKSEPACFARLSSLAARMLVLRRSTNVRPASVYLPPVSLDGHIALYSVQQTSKAVPLSPWLPAINFAE
jgi:hypothetical protein